MRSAEHGAVALGARGAQYLADGRIEGDDPLAPFSPTAGRHLLRTDGFQHVADIMVNSFYDPEVDEGCAFEELISFHGGLGGPQTRPFILHPVRLEAPPGPIVGAAGVHGILEGLAAAAPGRRSLRDGGAAGAAGGGRQLGHGVGGRDGHRPGAPVTTPEIPPSTLAPPSEEAPGTGGSRLSAVVGWLRGRTDTSIGRLALLWFRRYFEASRNSGAAATGYITISALPAALVFIGIFNLARGNENAFADRIVTHMRLEGATASIVHDLFGTTADNVAAASVQSRSAS